MDELRELIAGRVYRFDESSWELVPGGAVRILRWGPGGEIRLELKDADGLGALLSRLERGWSGIPELPENEDDAAWTKINREFKLPAEGISTPQFRRRLGECETPGDFSKLVSAMEASRWGAIECCYAIVTLAQKYPPELREERLDLFEAVDGLLPPDLLSELGSHTSAGFSQRQLDAARAW